MSISIILPSALMRYSRGTGAVHVDSSCATVAAALAELASRWPAVTDRVLTEQGELRRHVNVFVGAGPYYNTNGTIDTTFGAGGMELYVDGTLTESYAVDPETGKVRPNAGVIHLDGEPALPEGRL